MQTFKYHTYSFTEERLNIISHGIGLFLSILAFPFLIFKVYNQGSLHLISAIIYGLSLIILYTASTLYHKATKEITRKRLNVFDHASIFILIAGSYTPYLLLALNESLGFQFFIFIWMAAIIGVVLKLFFFGKYGLLSTIMYVIMGWVIVFVMKSLINNVAINGIYWLWIGGILYTLGAFFYSINKLKMNHFIFHVFVLLASMAHFISIYFYVLPIKI